MEPARMVQLPGAGLCSDAQQDSIDQAFAKDSQAFTMRTHYISYGWRRKIPFGNLGFCVSTMRKLA
jgi:hypothetical protein